jgi:hypothetical protein
VLKRPLPQISSGLFPARAHAGTPPVTHNELTPALPAGGIS